MPNFCLDIYSVKMHIISMCTATKQQGLKIMMMMMMMQLLPTFGQINSSKGNKLILLEKEQILDKNNNTQACYPITDFA